MRDTPSTSLQMAKISSISQNLWLVCSACSLIKSFLNWQIEILLLYSQAKVKAVIKRCNRNGCCSCGHIMLRFSKWKAKGDSRNTL